MCLFILLVCLFFSTSLSPPYILTYDNAYIYFYYFVWGYIYIYSIYLILFIGPVDRSRPSVPGDFTAAMVPTAEVMAAVLVALPEKSSPRHPRIKRVWLSDEVFELYYPLDVAPSQ